MKLHKSLSSLEPYAGSPYGTQAITYSGRQSSIEGMIAIDVFSNPTTYEEEVRQSRFFYRYDPIVSTVINRMVDMSITNLINKRKKCSKEEIYFFDAIKSRIRAVLQVCALEYLISGMAVPDYGTIKVMGTRLDSKLGRKRYTIADPIWIRNTDTINIKRKPAGAGRYVYLKIDSQERTFLQTGGKLPDGTYDYQLYKQLTTEFPEYVKIVLESNASQILLERAFPILRKPLVNTDWPQPFLTGTLPALKHKLRIKQMDYSIATKAIEAILQVSAGDKDFPVVEDDPTLQELRQQFLSRSHTPNGDAVFRLFTNHTVKLQWIFPPLESLLSDTKYIEPNADIFIGLGFSRTLLVGESLRSNSGQSFASTLGPISALNEVRAAILLWIEYLYKQLAEYNNFSNIPEPSFSPINSADIVSLIQFAIDASREGILSKDTVARMFGSDYESEAQQKEYEETEDEPPVSIEEE